MDEKERTRALGLALGQIDKQFGKGSILRLGSKDAIVPVSVISTGSISLDAALGVGGFPRGRVVEIFGPESSGKTTLALHVIAEAQKAGGMAAFIDAEHALDPIYARKLGVDVDNLLVSQPDYGEQALEIAEALIRSGAVDVIVVDSVAALVPKAELEGEMGDSHMGLQARLMSQALRKLTGIVSKSNTCLIFINQIREKIGVMFGNPGNHHRRPRAEVLRLGPRRHPPHRRHQGRRRRHRQPHQRQGCEEQSRRRRSAKPSSTSSTAKESRAKAICSTSAWRNNIVEKSGSWFSFKGERIGQGRENARQFLKDNTDFTKGSTWSCARRWGWCPIPRPRMAIAMAQPRRRQRSNPLRPLPHAAVDPFSGAAQRRRGPAESSQPRLSALPEHQSCPKGRKLGIFCIFLFTSPV